MERLKKAIKPLRGKGLMGLRKQAATVSDVPNDSFRRLRLVSSARARQSVRLSAEATMDGERWALREALLRYAHAGSKGETPALFVEFLDAHPLAFERSDAFGHFTGSAWLVSADGARVLLTHHRKLNAWLQLGGHADGETDLARVALREAEEESGLSDLVVEPAIFDIDRHRIPARPGEPEHWHYDVRYVVRATGSEAFVVGDESHSLEWRPIAELVGEAGLDASVRRMAQKWLTNRHEAWRTRVG